ncbi:MAG TPA: APC family permease [Nitrospira sp.]
MFLKRLLVGPALKTARAAEERLTKTVALAVFASDPLSSVAYATEEILLILVLAGTAFVHFSIPISLCILTLLTILTLSYREIIFEYPTGGGAYIVAKTNLGELPGLTAAAALTIDYVLTVAVSVAAGVAAVTSAFPSLHSHRVTIGVVAVLFVMTINLRGVRESGKFFAVPTYLFIASLLLMIGVGGWQVFMGQRHSIVVQESPVVESLTFFLLLRAFSSGCTAVTGVEVISNGVSAFKHPESKNAASTMSAMAVILAVLFLGITLLASLYGVLPREDETVVSQIARATFGEGTLYYVVQVSTMAILILAANSSFHGFPRLASILARDGYMPHQMSGMGDRLVFSNGIIVLGLLACFLIVAFEGETHALIPLYAVGVFLSFTLSQAGMVKHWLHNRGLHWQKRLTINAVGALATGGATVIIAATKFLHGAWIVVALLPFIIWLFRKVHEHYGAVERQMALTRDHRPPKPRRNIVLIPISEVNRAALQALDYARGHGGDVRALFVGVDSEATARFEMQWAQWGCGVPLVVVPSPYRSIVGSLLDYIEELLDKDQNCWVTVVIPEVLPARWWHNVLHNQRALILKAALLFRNRVILTDVPFHLEQ